MNALSRWWHRDYLTAALALGLVPAPDESFQAFRDRVTLYLIRAGQRDYPGRV